MRTPHPASLILILGLLLMALGPAGCGFQPRGSVPQIDGLAGPLYISGIARYSPLHRELSRQLRQAGLSLTDQGSEAGSLLRIADYRSERRLFTVDSRNQAAEYELEEALRFNLRSPSGAELVQDQTVRVLRILYRPNDEILARDREEQVLREEMRRELAGRMLNRIRAGS